VSFLNKFDINIESKLFTKAAQLHKFEIWQQRSNFENGASHKKWLLFYQNEKKGCFGRKTLARKLIWRGWCLEVIEGLGVWGLELFDCRKSNLARLWEVKTVDQSKRMSRCFYEFQRSIVAVLEYLQIPRIAMILIIFYVQRSAFIYLAYSKSNKHSIQDFRNQKPQCKFDVAKSLPLNNGIEGTENFFRYFEVPAN
jgi:hypothetical protein